MPYLEEGERYPPPGLLVRHAEVRHPVLHDVVENVRIPNLFVTLGWAPSITGVRKRPTEASWQPLLCQVCHELWSKAGQRSRMRCQIEDDTWGAEKCSSVDALRIMEDGYDNPWL